MTTSPATPGPTTEHIDPDLMRASVAAALDAISLEVDAVLRTREMVNELLPRALGFLHATRGRVVVSGLGKSGHIGAKIAATLASTGTPAFFVHATEALHGDSGVVGDLDRAILISNSGSTAEVVQFAAMLRARGIPLIALTTEPTSPLARLADLCLPIVADREADPLNLAPTSTTTATLVLGDALAAGLMELRSFTPQQFHQFHPGGSLGASLRETTPWS